MLMHKYGREFSMRVTENQQGLVSERVRFLAWRSWTATFTGRGELLTIADQITRKLTVETPSEELVNAYLTEIAKGYKIDWPPGGEGFKVSNMTCCLNRLP
jgi:vacuolar protein sorting-associated protein IST1